MASTIHHMGIDIRGVLNWKPAQLKKLFKSTDGSKISVEDVKEYLYDKLSEGYETLPLSGTECEGFDKVKGCPGHPTKD